MANSLPKMFAYVLLFYLLRASDSAPITGDPDDCYGQHPALRNRLQWEQYMLQCMNSRQFQILSGQKNLPFLDEGLFFTPNQLRYLHLFDGPLESNHPLEPALRMEYRTLKQEERQRFHKCIRRLKTDQIDGISKYDLFSKLHNIDLSPGSHIGSAVLLWHREFLRREMVHVSVTVPVMEFSVAMVAKYYGSMSAKLVETLLAGEVNTLTGLVRSTGWSLSDVKLALGSLIQHDVVRFMRKGDSENGYSDVLYEVNTVQSFRLSRISSCLANVKRAYGYLSFAILKELFLAGMLNHTECVDAVLKRFRSANDQSVTLADIQRAFQRLVSEKIIKRCSEVSPISESEIPVFVSIKDPFMPPFFQSPSGSDKGAEEFLFGLNYDELDRMKRRALVVEFFKSRFGELGGQLISIIIPKDDLQSSSCRRSKELRLQSVVKSLPPWMSNVGFADVTDFFQCIAKDPLDFVIERRYPAETCYCFNYSKIFRIICVAEIQKLIASTLGNHALKLFSILSKKGPMTEEQLETEALIEARLFKEVLHVCLRKKFIFMREFSKTGDFMVTKCKYMLYTNIGDTVLDMLDMGCKAIKNAVERRFLEHQANAQLVSRENKYVDACNRIRADASVDEEMRQQHIDEINEIYVSATEKELLEKHRRRNTILDALKINIADSVFVLETYLLYYPARSYVNDIPRDEEDM